MNLRTFPVVSLALLFAAAAFAAKPLPLTTVTETEAYASVAEAAVAALKIAIPLSGSYEHGGAIVERAGKFYYSDPVSNGDTGHIRFRAGVPKDGKLAAIYHTHPSGPDSKLFSWDDVREAKQLDVDSYIGVLADGTIRRFDPRRTPTRRYDVPGSPFALGKVSEGETVATLSKR